MRKADWRDALKVDFCEDGAFKARLLESLMLRPDAPIDDKEDLPMKTTIKHSARVLIAALVAVLLLSGVALAMMKTLMLGPFATFTQSDDVLLRQEIDEYVNGNRSVWEGKLFFADGSPVEDLAEYMIQGSKGEHQYELYNADGALAGLAVVNDEMMLVDIGDMMKNPNINEASFDTFDAVKPHLNAALIPTLPTILPDGYALKHFSVFTDEDGVPYPNSKYLTATYESGDKAFGIHIQVMDEETAFELSTSAALSEFTINDHHAIADGRNLSILIGDILYDIYPADSGLTLDELIKMAESM